MPLLMLALTCLQKSLVAGTAKEKEATLPANFCRDLTETNLELSRDSLKRANFLFFPHREWKLVSGSPKENKRRGFPELGLKQTFFRPMKYPHETKTKGVIKIAVLARSKPLQDEWFPCKILSCPTCRSSIYWESGTWWEQMKWETPRPVEW